MLIGDFNARVGNLIDFEDVDGFMSDICGFEIDDDAVDLLNQYSIPLNLM